MYIPANSCIAIHIHAHIQIHIAIDTNISTHTYIHVYTYTHIHIHKRIVYVHTCAFVRCNAIISTTFTCNNCRRFSFSCCNTVTRFLAWHSMLRAARVLFWDSTHVTCNCVFLGPHITLHSLECVYFGTSHRTLYCGAATHCTTVQHIWTLGNTRQHMATTHCPSTHCTIYFGIATLRCNLETDFAVTPHQHTKLENPATTTLALQHSSPAVYNVYILGVRVYILGPHITLPSLQCVYFGSKFVYFGTTHHIAQPTVCIFWE